VLRTRKRATGLGSALAGRDSHPLDDFSEFHEVIARPS